MSYSSLKRKTPLRAKSGFKPSCGFKKDGGGFVSDEVKKTPSSGRERPKKAKKSAKSSLETHLDIVFSLFVRLRDAMDGGRVRCISCGRVFPFEQVQCGHFFTRHNKSVRWDEENCNAECVRCNCFDDSHLDGYARNLQAKIGKEAFKALKVRACSERKWSGDELRELIKHYKCEVRRLSKEKGISIRL